MKVNLYCYIHVFFIKCRKKPRVRLRHVVVYSPRDGLEDFLIFYRNVNTSLPGFLPRLLTHEQFMIFQYALALLLFMASLYGVISNGINIYVFRKMDLRDSVTVSFLGLAISDFLMSLFNFMGSAANVLFAEDLRVTIKLPFDPFMFFVQAIYLSYICYLVTIILTMAIATVRCMCVIMPLQFRHTFTAKRCLRFICGCWVFAMSLYFSLSAVASTTIAKVLHTASNSTRYVLAVTSIRHDLKDFVFLFVNGALAPIAQLVLLFCIIAMTSVLRKSTSFRQGMSVKVCQAVRTTRTSEDHRPVESVLTQWTQDTTLSRRERRVITQVVSLSVLFLVCNLPGIIVGVATLLVPDLDAIPQEDRYARLYFSIMATRRFFEQVNSSSNIFIYFKYNRKFRDISGNWLKSLYHKKRISE